MTRLASIIAMTLVAACMAAPFLADRVFQQDLLDPVRQVAVLATPAHPLIGLAAR